MSISILSIKHKLIVVVHIEILLVTRCFNHELVTLFIACVCFHYSQNVYLLTGMLSVLLVPDCDFVSLHVKCCGLANIIDFHVDFQESINSTRYLKGVVTDLTLVI